MKILPPPNHLAKSLRLTNEEWAAICEIIADETVERAAVFGSRSTGIRTGSSDRPSDVDLAITLVWSIDQVRHVSQCAEFRKRHAAALEFYNIDVDWSGLGSNSENFHDNGTQVKP